VAANSSARHRRRLSREARLARTVIIGVAVVLGVVAGFVATGGGGGKGKPRSTSHLVHAAAPTTTTTTVPPFQRIPPGPPTDQRKLTLIKTIGGHISPKSVDASDTGLVFAQNMMYTHTMTVYDSQGNLVTTIPDTVNLAQLGVQGGPTVQGAPVEAAFTPDSRYVYVSNYSMYGPGQGPEGLDSCTPASAHAAGDTPSYVYRVDTKTLQVDQVIQVGLVPKFVAVTPDGRYLLITNWCSWDLDIIDTATAKIVADLPTSSTPRGIAVSPDSSTAYIAIMGGSTILKVNLQNLTEEGAIEVGDNPRSDVIDPAGRYLYVSLNQPGEVVKVDLTNDQVVGSVQTGALCRSLAISTDGRSLYVVNYDSNTMTKVRASDMTILQTVTTGTNPIGVTYDATTGDVWVAVYSGEILVFADQ
jgi:YVTN family beta-propeller protein